MKRHSALAIVTNRYSENKAAGYHESPSPADRAGLLLHGWLAVVMIWFIPSSPARATVEWMQGFESGAGAWTIEGGVWQVGPPTAASGPGAFAGNNVAGTVLAGNYGTNADARLVSPQFTVPAASELPRFAYWHWYSFGSGDSGRLQISVDGGGWADLPEVVFGLSGGGAWVRRSVDLRDYAGMQVRIGFHFVSNATVGVSLGWYVDDASLETGTMTFEGVQDFESDFGDWSVENGVWQWGEPTAANGPPSAHSGSMVVGTILTEDYGVSADARLVSPEINVPTGAELPRIRFWYWYDTYNSLDPGQVQIRVDGGDWENLEGHTLFSFGGEWSQGIVALEDFSGQSIQLGFRFVSNNTLSSASSGLFIDDVSFETGPMTLWNPEDFEAGFSDWSAEGGVWQIGAPSAAGGPTAHSGSNVAGTILGGNYDKLGSARLVSPIIIVPVAAANPIFSFWQWYVTAGAADTGRVQIREVGGEWTDLSGVVSGSGGAWTNQAISLAPYAEMSVQLGFLFEKTSNSANLGWYVDDLELISDTLDPISDQVIPEEQSFELPLGSTGNDLIFDFNPEGPAGATLDSDNRQFVWTPSEGQGPALFSDIEVWVTQTGSALTPVDRQSFGVTVNEINVAPVLGLPTSQTLDELTELSVVIGASDHDLPANTLTLELVSGPTGVEFNPLTGALNWTPTEAQGPGEYEIEVKVTDNNPDAVNEQQLSEMRSFSVMVHEANVAPSVTPVGSQSGSEHVPFSIVVSASDSDLPANTLTFSLVNPPTGASIDPVSGEFSWTPGETFGGTTPQITVRVTDNGVNPDALSTNISFDIAVAEVNDAPVLMVPSSPVTIDESAPWILPMSASDSDLPANALTYSLTSGPSGLGIDPGTGLVSWTPGESTGGQEFTVTVKATDNGDPILNDEESFLVVVVEKNVAPVLSLLGDQTAEEGSLFTVMAVGTDDDDPVNTLSYSLTEAPEGAEIDPNSGLISWTPGELAGGQSFPMTVQVTDNGEGMLSDEMMFIVAVEETNVAPVLAAIEAQSAEEGSLFTVSATASDDDDPANALTYALITAPSGATINPASGLVSWTPGESDGGGEFPMTVKVTDNGDGSLSDETSFTVSVAETNVAPKLAEIGNQLAEEGSLFSVNANASDDDDPANPLTYSLTQAPSGLEIHPDTGLVTWTPGESAGGGIFPVTVKVNDGGEGNLSDETTFSVSVSEVNSAPQLAALADQTIDKRSRFEFMAEGTDTDDPVNTLIYRLTQAPEGASIDPDTGLISWTPSESQGPGVHSFTVEVEDNGSPLMSTSESFVVTVNDVNNAPDIVPIPDFNQRFGIPVNLTVSASDSDERGDTLTFSLDVAPSGMTIDPVTGFINWSPNEDQAGKTLLVSVRVTDDGTPALFKTETFRVLVTGVEPTVRVRMTDARLAELEIDGQIGVNFEIWVSPNLVDWDSLFEFQLVNPPFIFTDEESLGEDTRFYLIRTAE